MLGNKSIVCVIPARMQSSRFPRKLLVPLGGKPLIQWAFEGAMRVSFFDKVVVAVDDPELYEVVTDFGGEALLTSLTCASGTERLIELQTKEKVQGDIWVNWQGDEPFITEETIACLLQSCNSGEVWTLKRKIKKEEEIESPHIVKVVCDAKGHALYFSRSCIPSDKKNLYKHIGIYAYTDAALRKISSLSPCPLEQQESLEQLRFLYHGMQIQVHETTQEIIGIDTQEELAIAEKMCYHLT
ncbi:MAG: 3-deoxy-manno-octulosonate cytidylyltransferase [Chlamydiae bacterium]|nr:3-deoxy-manno-octulosonate cytidylyltransferase [Chlamydiota bacterium]